MLHVSHVVPLLKLLSVLRHIYLMLFRCCVRVCIGSAGSTKTTLCKTKNSASQCCDFIIFFDIVVAVNLALVRGYSIQFNKSLLYYQGRKQISQYSVMEIAVIFDSKLLACCFGSICLDCFIMCLFQR